MLNLSLGLNLQRIGGTGEPAAGPTIDTAGSVSPDTYEIGTEETITAGTASATGGGTVTYEYRYLLPAPRGVQSTIATWTPVAADDTYFALSQWRAVETGGTNPGATAWQTVGSGTITYPEDLVATGVESAMQTGTPRLALVATGTEITMETGQPSIAAFPALVATGAEIATETGAPAIAPTNLVVDEIEVATETGESTMVPIPNAPVLTGTLEINETTYSDAITADKSCEVYFALGTGTPPGNSDAIDVINGVYANLVAVDNQSYNGTGDVELTYNLPVSSGTYWAVATARVEGAQNSAPSNVLVDTNVFVSTSSMIAIGAELAVEVQMPAIAGGNLVANGAEIAVNVGAPVIAEQAWAFSGDQITTLPADEGWEFTGDRIDTIPEAA